MKYKPTYRVSLLDLETWNWIVNHYTARVEDICILRGIKERTAYEHIRAWRKHDYFTSKAGFLVATQRTLWECGTPYKFHDLGLDFLTHAHDVIKVEHWLGRREDMVILDWAGERELRHMQGVHHTVDTRDIHIADAEATILSRATDTTQFVAIEIERSYKGPRRTYEALTRLAAKYEHIWYFADVRNVYRPLAACIETLPPEDIPKFSLWKLDTITRDPKARSTRTHV
jgi:hypothetical protein